MHVLFRALKRNYLASSCAALLVGMAVLLPLIAAPVNAAAPQYVPGVVLVDFRPGASASERAAARSAVGAVRAKRLSPLSGHAEKLKLPAGTGVERALKALRRNPSVRVAEPDYLLTHYATADDPSYTSGNLWGMYGDATSPANSYGSQAGEAWAAGHTGDRAVYVGVIDEGLQIDHPDLAVNVWVNAGEIAGNGVDDDGNGKTDDINGWDFANEDASVYDGSSDDHGTHVAGTIGAQGGNGIGVAGVNWNVTLISAKFLGARGGSTSDAIAAVDYITDLKIRHGLNIVATSNSWGGGGFSQLLLDAINRGGDQDILFIAAAGNDGSNTDSAGYYPSNYQCTTATRGWDCVVSVASITSSGSMSSFSNYGQVTVDIGAPGSVIDSTLPGDSYGSYSGTSMATPHVSGAAALCASIDQTQTGFELRNALLNSAAATASLAGKTTTGGRLDVGAMVSLCQLPTEAVSGPPVDLVATATSTSTVDLVWNGAGVNHENSYEVERSTDACSTFEHAGLTVADAAGFTVEGLEPSTEYCFRVRATNRLPSASAWSISNPATTFDPPPPYVCEASADTWQDIGSAPSLNLGDDDQATVNLGFEFPFYGTPFNSIEVVSNGLIKFGSGSATTFQNVAIPTGTAPNGFMAPLWDDLNPAAGGAVRAQSTGSAPNRLFVVTWDGVPHFNVSGSAVTMQVQLEEATGEAVFAYQDVIFGMPTYDYGESATVGIEDGDGAWGTEISYEQPNISAPSAYRCTPGDPTGEPQPQPPGPFTLSAPAVSSTLVTLSWTVSSGAVSYEIERDGEQVASGLTGNGYEDGDVSPGFTYEYTVTAHNADGSTPSNLLSVDTPLPPPAMPASVSASWASPTVTVAWSGPDGWPEGTSFQVEREEKHSKRNSWRSRTLVATVTDVPTVELTPDAGEYRYYVRAVNAGGTSAWAGPSAPVVVSDGGGGDGGGGGRGNGRKK
jgi:subtilisin family serine protease